MKDIMVSITRTLNLLNQQFSDISKQLRSLHWEEDAVSIQILRAELVEVERELVKASFVNCTPHQLSIEGIGDLLPSGILSRVSTVYCDTLAISGVRVRQKVWGEDTVTGLPDPAEGITFIVSGMVRETLSVSDALSALPEFQSRPDVYAPDTGSDAIRNEKGQIVAVRGLVQ